MATPKKTTKRNPKLTIPDGLILYQAITQSYKLRYRLHAMKPDAPKTICGRAVFKGSHEKFDPNVQGACQKCLQSIDVLGRVHAGWEDA